MDSSGVRAHHRQLARHVVFARWRATPHLAREEACEITTLTVLHHHVHLAPPQVEFLDEDGMTLHEQLMPHLKHPRVLPEDAVCLWHMVRSYEHLDALGRTQMNSDALGRIIGTHLRFIVHLDALDRDALECLLVDGEHREPRRASPEDLDKIVIGWLLLRLALTFR